MSTRRRPAEIGSWVTLAGWRACTSTRLTYLLLLALAEIKLQQRAGVQAAWRRRSISSGPCARDRGRCTAPRRGSAGAAHAVDAHRHVQLALAAAGADHGVVCQEVGDQDVDGVGLGRRCARACEGGLDALGVLDEGRAGLLLQAVKSTTSRSLTQGSAATTARLAAVARLDVDQGAVGGTAGDADACGCAASRAAAPRRRGGGGGRGCRR